MTQETFLQKLNSACSDTFGIGYDDLPDIIFIDDYFDEEMTTEEVQDAIDEIIQTLEEEL